MKNNKDERKKELLSSIMAKLKAGEINVSDLSDVKRCLDGCVGSGLYEVFINARR